MEYKEVLSARHSVRKFDGRPVVIDEIYGILEEARLAPSSKNTKSTGFMIIEDKSVLEAIAQMRESGSAFVGGAAAAVVVLGDESKSDLWVENCSISATYVMLSAANRGIGSCWVHVNGRPRSKTDVSKGSAEQYLRDLLGLKDNMRPLCVIALGYEARS